MDTINDILFWVCLYVLLWNAYFLVFNRGIPNINTAPAIRKKAAALLKEDFKRRGKDTYTVIDLGSGNGNFSRHIARAMPQARVIGIDIDRIAHFRANLARRLCGLKNLEYRRGDFYEQDLSGADAVVLFLLGTLMGRIRPKLERDLKDGALVISNKFAIGGDWVPVDVLEVKTLYPHQKKVFVYRKGEKPAA